MSVLATGIDAVTPHRKVPSGSPHYCLACVDRWDQKLTINQTKLICWYSRLHVIIFIVHTH